MAVLIDRLFHCEGGKDMEETAEEKEAREAAEAEALKEKEAKDEEKAAKKAEKEAEKAAKDAERNRIDTITLKGVVLKGSQAEKTGTHSIHLTPSKIVNFVNGKAEVKADVEESLRASGYIE